MKKKIVISFLTFVLLAMLCGIPTLAASATANVNSTSGNRGATVTMTVTLVKGVTVGSGGIELTYDKAVLELVKGEWNVNNPTLATFDTSNNKGAFAYAGSTQISGKVFTATFKVKSNASFGDSAVKMVLQLKDGSNANISVTNNAGKVTVTCKHSYSKWSSANGTSHTRTCSICQNKETKNHAFTNACDTSCNDCGYTRTITHNYKTAWSSNGTQHWHECSVCGNKKDTANHTPGPAATETTPQTCTSCGYVLQEALGHTHVYDDTWSSDAGGHHKICTSCGESTATEAHLFDHNCDTDCNVCGFVRTITHAFGNDFVSDEEMHWHVCGVCQVISEKVAHTYDHGCDTSCNDCGHARVTEHVFDDGVITKIPTLDVAGEKTYTCSVCGGTKVVELEYYIPETEADTEEDTTEPPVTTVPETEAVTTDVAVTSTINATESDNDAAGGLAWWWLIVVGVGGIALGIGCGLLIGKKKK